LPEEPGEHEHYVCDALTVLGAAAHRQGAIERAVSLFEQSLDRTRQFGHRWGYAAARTYLALVVLDQADYERVEALCEESLTLARALGEARNCALLLAAQGQAASRRGAAARAAELFQENLALRQEGITISED
jgi:tetratricopeptide (TPR) repeat protein